MNKAKSTGKFSGMMNIQFLSFFNHNHKLFCTESKHIFVTSVSGAVIAVGIISTACVNLFFNLV